MVIVIIEENKMWIQMQIQIIFQELWIIIIIEDILKIHRVRDIDLNDLKGLNDLKIEEDRLKIKIKIKTIDKIHKTEEDKTKELEGKTPIPDKTANQAKTDDQTNEEDPQTLIHKTAKVKECATIP